MAVPVSYTRRLVCATRRSPASPTVLRAALIREQFSPALKRPLWNALAQAAGMDEHPDDNQRQTVLDDLIERSAAEIVAATPEMVADILTRKRDILEGVEGVQQ